MKPMFYIQTTDGKLTIMQQKGMTYEIAANHPQTRKTWKTRRGAEAALDRIKQITPTGSRILEVKETL